MRDSPLPEMHLEPKPADTDILEAEREKHRKRYIWFHATLVGL